MLALRDRPRPVRMWSVALLMALFVAVAGCSSGGSDSASPTTTTPAVTTSQQVPAQDSDWEPPACDREPATIPDADPVEGSPNDFDLVSFDDTTIRIHWFPRENSGEANSPTVLMGPGWSLPGDTNDDPSAEPGIQGVASIGGLHEAGYNVATWDPRGFGASGGTVTVDSADFEAKDVSTLIDWVAHQDGVTLDGEGDPRVGMAGASYGGGIQFVTAATDCRVDVITPTIAWNSLATSLYPAETYKAGWAGLLVSLGDTSTLDPHILSAADDAEASGVLSQDDREWFLDRGPDDLLAGIDIPTLIVQGTVDNLFPLSEGVRNNVAIAANDVPLAMTWFCGGHGVCNGPADPDGYVGDAVLNWLARYLGDDSTADPVPGFQTTDQNGKVHTFASYPVPDAAKPVFAFADSGTLALQPDGGSGPLTDVPEDEVIGALAAKITPGKATQAFDVPVPVAAADRLLLGAPELGLGYTCTLEGEADKPTRMFAQLVDDTTDRVLGNQITPIAITCDGLLHQTQVPLEPIVYAPGDDDAALTLQLVASTVAYGIPQMDGTVDFARVELSIPSVGE